VREPTDFRHYQKQTFIKKVKHKNSCMSFKKENAFLTNDPISGKFGMG
jgi:hypothetical protein